jgi:DNA-binding Xre family transcriptional regulator
MTLSNAIRLLFDSFRPLRENSCPVQRDFAIKTGLTKNRYSLLETTAENCELMNFLRICIHLKVKPWVLMEAELGEIWDEVCERELNS